MRIEEFIEARLAEDEQIARESDTGDGEWFYDDRFDRVETSDENLYTLHHSEHIARHDPARVLRQTAALRDLYERALPERECRGHPGPWMHCGDYGPGYCGMPDEADALRVIAAIWSNHPDYQPEWAVTIPR
ncbi:DUF6221 family protein [Nocardia abscessus]|uniref:DUF6221 family protein n=1 Tax=Nocardia abscessus TaxID=120957 RepID=UPI002454EBCC|nr:DUF6221 family protein [Nocardia abscessus]